MAAYGDFTRVRPEQLRDFEAGVNITKRTFDLSANVYSMDFRNDIARIGAPTASGAILRRNVGSSYRRGLEVDWAYRGIDRVVLAGNATWSTNRIQQFTDSSRGTPVVRRNVEPLLTPRFTSAHRVEVTPVQRLWVSVEGRAAGRAGLCAPVDCHAPRAAGVGGRAGVRPCPRPAGHGRTADSLVCKWRRRPLPEAVVRLPAPLAARRPVGRCTRRDTAPAS